MNKAKLLEARNQKPEARCQRSGVRKICLLFSILCLLSSTAYANMDDAWSCFLKGDYERAITNAENIETDQAHYLMALSYLKLEVIPQARKHFTFILDMYPQAKMLEEVSLGLADAYFLEGDFENALIKYNDFLNKFPSSPLLSIAYLRLGQTQRKLGLWQEAKATLSKVIENFPDSLEKSPAQKELANEFYYYIQVASFSRKLNASRTSESLAKKGYKVYIKTATNGKGTFYRVCFGEYDNKQDAIVALDKIKKDGYEAKILP